MLGTTDKISNPFLGGDFVQTNIDLATMEGLPNALDLPIPGRH